MDSSISCHLSWGILHYISCYFNQICTTYLKSPFLLIMTPKDWDLKTQHQISCQKTPVYICNSVEFLIVNWMCVRVSLPDKTACEFKCKFAALLYN